MLLLVIILAISVIGSSYLSFDNSSIIMERYCNLECTERKLKKYSICC